MMIYFYDITMKRASMYAKSSIFYEYSISR